MSPFLPARGAMAVLLVIAAAAAPAAACYAASVDVDPNFVKPALPISKSAFDHVRRSRTWRGRCIGLV